MNKKNVLTGKVVHGKALGRTVGMPTANLCVESGELPALGVYATKILVGDVWYASVTNIGTRPTVDGEHTITVETFILDFEQDIYGEKVMLEICEFLRPIQKFSCLDDVFSQVKKDVEKAKNVLTSTK